MSWPHGSPAAKSFEEAERRVTTRERVLSLIKGNPSISISDIAEQLRVSRSAIAKHVDVLRTQIGLMHKGPRKGGRWVIGEG